MQVTALKLQELASNFQSYLREQGHIQDDVIEVRRMLSSVHQMLQEGSPTNPSVLTRLYVAEREIDSIKQGQLRTRDWWLKLVATLSAAAIITLAGVGMMIYMASKGMSVKP
jgi:proteasome assembly chaperone (PAC2) family protein